MMSDDLVDRLRADAKFMDDRFGLPAAQNAATVAANEITALRAQLAAAEDENKELVLELLAAQGQAADAINDKLAAMERVREAVKAEFTAHPWSWNKFEIHGKIDALKLDALAEGEK